MTQYKQQVFELVNLIPAGRVTNFGTIGKLIGISGQMVGWILSGMSETEWNTQDCVAWYRVVAKDGSISSLKLGIKGEIQRQILLDQGYTLIDNKVDMSQHFFGFEDSLF
jgi:methylated-DNA-protein-cysteine methyltransferase related protein